MAPTLHFALRQILQKQEISPQAIDNYMSSLKSLDRYNKPFQYIWCILQNQNVDPPEATIPQIVSALIQLNSFSPSQARNAYSALVCFPPFQGLKFNAQLLPFKRKWNQNVQKYGSFWDAEHVLQALAGQQLNPSDIRGHRDRLILCMRLLALHRGIDLARSQRTLSVLQNKAFILVQRKGWAFPKCEQIIHLPQTPQISPWHLLQKYVQLTEKYGTPGGPLLLALHPP
jgi:hypothetical protein